MPIVELSKIASNTKEAKCAGFFLADDAVFFAPDLY